MARSTYIYIAYSRELFLVAGTVKHEVITYVKRFFPTYCTEIRRYSDCGGSEYKILNLIKEGYV